MNLPDHLADKMTGLPPDMIQFFQDKYKQSMATKNRELREEAEAMQTTVVSQIPVEVEMQKIVIFCNFVRQFLKEHPPSTIQPLDRSYGVKLTTGETFVIGDSTAQVRGSMQPSHTLAVTGQPQALAEVYGQAGQPAVAPEGTQIMGGEAQADLTQNQGSQGFGG